MLGINGSVAAPLESPVAGPELLLALRRARLQFSTLAVTQARGAYAEQVPRIIVDEDAITFRFAVTSGGGEYSADVSLGFGQDRVTGRRMITVQCCCDCDGSKRSDACSHCCAAIGFLEEDLRRMPTEMLAKITSLFGRLKDRRGGKWFVERLVQLAERETGGENQAGVRMQWRLALRPTETRQPLRVTAYQQKLSARGKWSPGRQMDWSQYYYSDAFRDSPRDQEIVQILRYMASGYSHYETPVWESLEAMVDHPQTVWDDGRQTPVRVVRSELSISIDPLPPEGYACVLRMDDEVVRPDDARGGVALCGISTGTCRLLWADYQHNRLLFSQKLRPRLAELVGDMLRSEEARVPLRIDEAHQLIGSANRLGEMIRIDIPESLAGPCVAVETKVAVLLRPRGEGLEASLRVVDDRLPEPMVPGAAPAQVTTVTSDGPRRMVRALDDERALADRWASALPLDGFAVDAEYCWRTDQIERAIELLDFLRGLGSDGPEVLWPEGKKIRMVGEIVPSCLRVQVEERRDWFGITGALELDGLQIPLAELLEAIRRGGKYVRVGEDAFARIDESFRRRLEQLGATLQSDRGGARISSVAVPAVQDLIGEDCLLEATVKWRETLQRLDRARKMRPRVPRGLNADLREYQKEGYRWLARLSAWGAGGVLADDMGLGKTLQTLGVLLDRSAGGPVLIVAPTSVGENWLRETKRFAPRLVPHLYRDHDRDALLENAGPGDMVITSYALLQRDAERFLARSWHTLVLDEAQYIKNAATKTARAAREIEADWRLALSGTPLENHLGELWSLMRTILPGLLGSWEHFRTRFADPIEKHGDDERRQALARLVQPFILRRTKKAVLSELPPRTEVNLFAEMESSERKRYEAARMAAIKELAEGGSDSDGQQRFRVLAWLTRMRQLACHPRLVDPSWKGNSAKLNLFLETVEDLREGEHRALVFSQFVQHLALVREALDERGIRYQYLDGATPAAQRQERVDAFQRGEGELFLISLKAGGTGLNLTAADYVVHLDPWWNPAVEDQATDRAHRIGQERPVTVFRLVARDTIEEQILALHADKRELVASVLDGTDRAGRMNTAELIQLIRRGGD